MLEASWQSVEREGKEKVTKSLSLFHPSASCRFGWTLMERSASRISSQLTDVIDQITTHFNFESILGDLLSTKVSDRTLEGSLVVVMMSIVSMVAVWNY